MKKWRNWLSAILLTAIFAAGFTAGQSTVKAEPMPYDRSDNVSPEELVPRVGASRTTTVSPNAWKKINGICYNGSGKVIPGAITRGIDVSEWQGKIDWQKVKNSDVDFAFVRISYGSGYLDKTYDYNMQEAELAGVPVGTYVYSLATSTTMALKEAQLAIEKMKGKKVSYPVVFDLEDAGTMGKLSKSMVSKIALTFCDEIRQAGYTPMLYMNLNWYNNHVDWSLLEGSGLDVWVASFGDTINAPDNSKYTYTIWQSTAGDTIPGMNTTKKLIDGIPPENNVDVNFGFVDYTTKIAPRWEPKAGYIPSTQPLYPDETVKNGLITENGKTYYYVNGTMYTGWRKISGKYYFFSKIAGYMLKSKLVKVDGSIYYVDKNGARVSNKFLTKSNKTYYFGSNGKAYKGWHTINGKKYYFYKGEGPNAGVRAENITLTSSTGVVSVFNKNGVCTKQYRK